MRNLKVFGSTRCLLGFVILTGLSALAACAQSVGAFVPTGVMATPRTSHTATLLKDGRVLIAGGLHCDVLNNCDSLASAELYDPVTETFTSTGNMTIGRFQHVATLLSDGRVLIAGGSTLTANSQVQDFSAELYDPATGTFIATGNVASTPSSIALLGNGKVLVIVGEGVGDIPNLGAAEIYDPAKGIFTPAGPVVNQNLSPPALLADGRVLISGDKISLYEVAPDSLKLAASLPESGVAGDQTATLLTNGKVLIAGGWCSDSRPCKTTDDAYLYDPHSGTLESTGLLAIPRYTHAATLLPGGRVLIVGGNGNDYDAAIPCVKDAEEYDPSTGSFTYAGTEALLNCLPRATLLADGRVLITGGSDLVPYPGVADLYIPALRAASAASLTGPLAPESVASLFGSRLASSTASADAQSPPTSLGGINLRVRDSSGVARLAPLFFVSPAEIRFEVPPGTPLGDVTLELVNAPTQPAPVAAQVQNVAPGIFPFEDNMVAGPSLERGTMILDGGPVDLVVYGTGIRHFSTLGNVRATIGGAGVTVMSAGPDTSVPGLDQVKIHVPSDFQGRGFLDLVVTADGIPSNTTSVQILGGRGAASASELRTTPAPRR